MKQQLDIETPDEFWTDYTENVSDCNQKIYFSLVNKLGIKYFVPYIHNENNLPQDLNELFDHPCRVLTANNRYYTIVQPYNYVKINQIMNKYYLKKLYCMDNRLSLSRYICHYFYRRNHRIFVKVSVFAEWKI